MLTLKRGATQPVSVTLTDENGALLISGTGDSVQLRIGLQGTAGQIVRTMVQGGSGVYSYEFTPADTTNLNGPNYVLEVWFLALGGKAYPMLTCQVTVANSILAS